ncbi:hypothetical protein [Apilactobacillus micheneri]|uniref:hypothetical protein n=1 Tax=Apilactobacillus micheneri TaxID=1899430 RepID=UPI0015E83308|nr:hypothetical protein [Apilactobacillus micheneri]
MAELNTKYIVDFNKCKEAKKLNNYFAEQGYTIAMAKTLLNWYLKTLDNSQKITKK